SNVVWVGAIALGAHLYARRRDRLAAVGFAAGLSAGLVCASIGSALAAANPNGLVRVMVDDTARFLLRTIALGARAGLLAYRTPRRALGATLAVAALGTVGDAIVRRLHAGLLTHATLTAASVAALSAVVLSALRRTRLEQTHALDAQPAGLANGE